MSWPVVALHGAWPSVVIPTMITFPFPLFVSILCYRGSLMVSDIQQKDKIKGKMNKAEHGNGMSTKKPEPKA
ncbi:hypothetical protein Tco_1414488, partial [Tanacetum coccineum]